jgi:hypothetical protein
MTVLDLPSDAPEFEGNRPQRRSFSPRSYPRPRCRNWTPWAVRSYSQLVSGEAHEPAFAFDDADSFEGFFAFAAGRVPGNLSA